MWNWLKRKPKVEEPEAVVETPDWRTDNAEYKKLLTALQHDLSHEDPEVRKSASERLAEIYKQDREDAEDLFLPEDFPAKPLSPVVPGPPLQLAAPGIDHGPKDSKRDERGKPDPIIVWKGYTITDQRSLDNALAGIQDEIHALRRRAHQLKDAIQPVLDKQA